MDIIKLETVQDKIIDIRGEKVILDSDVAALYGVETKRINEAVKNNPNKFPKDYIIELKNEEWKALRLKISTLIKGGKVKLDKLIKELLFILRYFI